MGLVPVDVDGFRVAPSPGLVPLAGLDDALANDDLAGLDFLLFDGQVQLNIGDGLADAFQDRQFQVLAAVEQIHDVLLEFRSQVIPDGFLTLLEYLLVAVHTRFDVEAYVLLCFAHRASGHVRLCRSTEQPDGFLEKVVVYLLYRGLGLLGGYWQYPGFSRDLVLVGLGSGVSIRP